MTLPGWSGTPFGVTAGVTLGAYEILAPLGAGLAVIFFAAILYHRRAGFSANGMGVWAVPDDKIAEVRYRAAVQATQQRKKSASKPAR